MRSATIRRSPSISLLLILLMLAACGNPRSVARMTALERIEDGVYRRVVIDRYQLLLFPGRETVDGPDLVDLPQGRQYAEFKPRIHQAALQARQRGHEVVVENGLAEDPASPAAN